MMEATKNPDRPRYAITSLVRSAATCIQILVEWYGSDIALDLTAREILEAPVLDLGATLGPEMEDPPLPSIHNLRDKPAGPWVRSPLVHLAVDAGLKKDDPIIYSIIPKDIAAILAAEYLAKSTFGGPIDGLEKV
ncbi:MAG: hypothetical protein M3Y27_12205 [Acidobacteriota bacterium]|nr:hypothetical protein [Acidobacteriota bacterium]